MNKHNDVGVLFDGTRLAQVTQLRTLAVNALAVFHAAVQLAQRDDGDIQFLGFEVENGLVVVAGDQHETAHLRIGDGHGLMFLTVHDAADGKDVLQIVLQFAQKGTAGTDKDQVVDGRHELAHTTLLLHDVFVAHRDKVFYAGFVKILFECQFATVGDTNGIPMKNHGWKANQR